MSITVKVAIDPDIKKSGFACVINQEGVKTRIFKAFSIADLMNFFNEYRHLGNNVKIYLEASWLIEKSNWRANKGTESKNYTNSQSLDTGRNQGYGLAIKDIATSYGFDVIEIKPFIKPRGWKVKGSWTPTGREQFNRMFKFQERTINDDVRDAIYILNYFEKLS